MKIRKQHFFFGLKISTITLTSPTSCNKVIHPLTFIVTVTMGLCLVVLNTSLGLAITRFGKTTLISKFIFHEKHFKRTEYFCNHIVIVLKASWLIISMFSGLAIIWTNQFYVNTVLMILHMSTIICCTVLCGVFGDLFPTHLRYFMRVYNFNESINICLYFSGPWH